MPTSYSESIPAIVDLMKEIAPKKILDIGIGNGKYGLLAKEYVGNDVIVDGVEAYEPYITDIHRAIYRQIFIEDVAKLNIEKIEKYDLYLMIDVIEHLPKATGHRILRELSGLVLISTPIEDYRAHYENHFEDHVSHWTSEDFEMYSCKDFSTPLSTIVLLDTHPGAKHVAEQKKSEAMLQDVYNSHSWKVTKPLRALSERAKRKK